MWGEQCSFGIKIKFIIDFSCYFGEVDKKGVESEGNQGIIFVWDLIETYWDVKVAEDAPLSPVAEDLIETYWDVKQLVHKSCSFL